LFRSTFSVLAASCALALLQSPLPALAQAKPAATPAAPANQKPATPSEVDAYTAIGSVNVCLLSQAKIGMDQSMPAAVESVVTVLVQKHGSSVAGVNQKLTPQQLANGVATDMLVRIKRICYKSLSAQDQKKIDENIAKIEKSMKQPK
jgi:hypothetical protein